MKACVILNPYSNRWRARQRRPEMEAALKSAGIQYELVEMEGAGDGVAKAVEAVRAGFSPIIAAGGDGGISEVVNGLYRASSTEVLGPLGLMPLGTANDLVVNLGLPRDLNAMARIIAAGKTRRIDLGKVTLGEGEAEWVFDNNSAIGLEPVVTVHNVRIKRIKGILRYLVAALQAIGEGPHWQAKLQWEDGQYTGRVTLVSVGNCPLTGGLFRMAPAADPADGKLTFVYAYAASRLKMLSLLPRTISGDFVNDPAVQQRHAQRLVIELESESPIQIDGELRSLAVKKITYEALAGRLDVLSL